MNVPWTEGNEVQLLENGERFFARVLQAIEHARREVLLETFILAEDKVGLALQQALIAAAQRGASVEVTVDGYGSADLSPGYLQAMTAAGVRLHAFDPQPRLLGFRTNIFRRLHRKLVLVDRHVAFIGGINFCEDHLYEFGPDSKQDYAVEVRGPVVQQVLALLKGGGRRAGSAPQASGAAGMPAPSRPGATAALVLRDNEHHRQDIEHAYRLGIRSARREIVIANAYFFPGYRLLRDLRSAARRGVGVKLILRGRPDMRVVTWAVAMLQNHLLRGGVRIFQYCDRALHAKVAVIDGEFATVGSSNLDPLSLFLNLEANLLVRDRAFAQELRGCLETLIRESCREMVPASAGPLTWPRNLLGIAVFHLLRRLPQWSGWLPAHTQKRQPLAVPAAEDAVGPQAQRALERR